MAKKPLSGPLPADLPEDWALNQVVSPNGTEAGLDERHGYNYQGKQINAAQKGVNALNEGMGTKADLDSETMRVKADQMPPYQGPLKDSAIKATLVDADSVAVVDSADENKTKRVAWSSVITAIKTPLDSAYVPKTRKVNSKSLSADITLEAEDVGAAEAIHAHQVAEVTGALRQFGPVDLTAPVSGWTGAGPWTQNVAVDGVLASWDERLRLSLQKQVDEATRKAQDKALGCVTYCDTYDGGITLTCREKKPEVDLMVRLSGEV